MVDNGSSAEGMVVDCVLGCSRGTCGVEGSGVAGSREGRSIGVTGTEVVLEELSCVGGSSVEGSGVAASEDAGEEGRGVEVSCNKDGVEGRGCTECLGLD